MSNGLRAALDLLRGQFAYAQSPSTYLPGDFTTDYDDIIDRALALATSDGLDVACLSCGASVVDAVAGACHECGAEDRHIGSQWVSMPPEHRPLRSTPEAGS